MNIEIKNGRLIDPASGLDKVANLFVADGRIVAIGDAPRDCEAALLAGVGRAQQIGAPPLPPSLWAATEQLVNGHVW